MIYDGILVILYFLGRKVSKNFRTSKATIFKNYDLFSLPFFVMIQVRPGRDGRGAYFLKISRRVEVSVSGAYLSSRK